MKILRSLSIIATLVIITPFLGVPATWKQIISILLGIGIFVLIVFLKKEISSCSHTQDSNNVSGASFKDSEIKNDIVLEEDAQQDLL